MVKLLKYFPDSHAVIIGDGPYKNEIKKLCIKMNLNNRTHLLGRIPYHAMFDFIMDANIGFSLIKPKSQSYHQALPNKIFEYALANIPVIASSLPEMEKIINKFNIGSTVYYNDKNEQKKAINKLLVDKKIKNIQKIAEKYFVWEKQTDLFLAALKIYSPKHHKQL